jgi:hypothetical protein
MKGSARPHGTPRQLALVTLKPEFADVASRAPFSGDLPLVFLGEIPNMPEHGVFAGHRSGRLYSGYHISQFMELAPEDV